MPPIVSHVSSLYVDACGLCSSLRDASRMQHLLHTVFAVQPVKGPHGLFLSLWRPCDVSRVVILNLLHTLSGLDAVAASTFHLGCGPCSVVASTFHSGCGPCSVSPPCVWVICGMRPPVLPSWLWSPVPPWWLRLPVIPVVISFTESRLRPLIPVFCSDPLVVSQRLNAFHHESGGEVKSNQSWCWNLLYVPLTYLSMCNCVVCYLIEVLIFVSNMYFFEPNWLKFHTIKVLAKYAPCFVSHP